MSNTPSTLREDAEAELASDASVDATHGTVTEADGVRTLTGHAGSRFEKRAAEKAAGRVKGARAMVERVAVRLSPREELGANEIARLAADVIARNLMPPDDVVEVEVENGGVTLTGTVNRRYQKRGMEAGIRSLGGVTGVTNAITISHDVAASDVRESIAGVYRRSAQFDASNITVTVQGGLVTLSGQLKAWSDHRRVAKAVWDVAGVTGVVDHIHVG